jgi:hypothetical protein
MKYIGAHVSSSGGVENAPLNAKEQRPLLSLRKTRDNGFQIL